MRPRAAVNIADVNVHAKVFAIGLPGDGTGCLRWLGSES
jgi:hypothetical protein